MSLGRSVTSRFQSDSPLSLRAELLERTSKIHSSGARERENYPLLRRRSRGKYFKFLRLPPLAIMMPSRSKFRSGGELAIPGRRRKAGGAVFPGNDSSEAASEVGLGHRAARVLVSTEEQRMEDHRGSK